MKNQSSLANRPLRLFLSYAHADHRLFTQFCDALVPLERKRLVKVWDDRKIPPGGDWDRVIKSKLYEAEVVVFLVSRAFLASRYCWEEEVDRALDRTSEGVSVLPVYLEDVNPVLTPFGEFNSVPKEMGKLKPVGKFGHRASAWKSVQEALLGLAQEARSATDGVAEGERPLVAPRRVWQVPLGRPAHLVGRESMLERLPSEFGASGHQRTVALVGEGGVGKTSVAVEYCWRRRSDYDVVVWFHADPPTRLVVEYAAMAMAVGLPVLDQEASKAGFFEWLQANGRWLAVFDNAGEPEDLRAFLPEVIQGDVIVTSRNPVWDGVARQLAVGPLTRQEAMQYLLDASGAEDVISVAEMVVLSGGNPRELELAVRRVKTGDTLAAYVGEVKARAEGLS